MKTMTLCGLAMTVLACVALGGPAGAIGSAFADVYDAFAPLGVLHRAYADLLFYGTDVVIPGGLEDACEETGLLLALLHVDLLLQTGSQVVDTIPRLARFRANLADFGDEHAGMLIDISRTDPPDMVMLGQASELGLFSDIYGLQQGLQLVFEAYLDGLKDDQQRWSFAVAFALRTLLKQTELEAITGNLRDILYGSEGAMLPPAFVPQEIAAAIERLVELVEGPYEDFLGEEIRAFAQSIYDYVVSES